jgi:hypothetical protein
MHSRCPLVTVSNTSLCIKLCLPENSVCKFVDFACISDREKNLIQRDKGRVLCRVCYVAKVKSYAITHR